MTNEQLVEQVLKISADVYALTQDVKSAHHRISENDRVTDGIHKIAANVETLAVQMGHLAESTAASIAKLEESIRRLGERIGKLEGKPAKRWEALVTQLIGLAVAGAVGYMMANYF